MVRVRVRALMEVVLLVEVLKQSRPREKENISVLSAVEVLHAPQSVCAKDDAP